MMLLRTLVLEHSGHDSPVNGALLCCFAIPQIASNFLVYSLDEEVEPGSSRVYIAALRKKAERYFLGGIESKENLQLAMKVLKQIITLATGSGVKDGNTSESQVPYHFIDLKGSKLPTARPEDHHSLMIKKALVMKVITLGTSVIGLPAIESTELEIPEWNAVQQRDKLLGCSLTLRHQQHDRKPLGESTDEVLKHLHRLWGFDIHLETLQGDQVMKTHHVPHRRLCKFA